MSSLSPANAATPADLGPRAALLVDKHAEYIKGFSRIWEVRACMRARSAQPSPAIDASSAAALPRAGRPRVALPRPACSRRAPCALTPTNHRPTEPTPHKATDRIEAVATEHFWISGMYWGLTAMAVMGRLDEMDCEAVAEWVLTCKKEGGGFGSSPRNDAHLLYTLSAVQVGFCCGGGVGFLRRGCWLGSVGDQ
jgi:hypothetical protein